MRINKFLLTITLGIILAISSCNTTKKTTTASVEKTSEIIFDINLLDLSNDTFKVKVKTPQLSATNNIFQFASTAPGTYQIMNIGKYVTKFAAYDKNNTEIPTTKQGLNQYVISTPAKVDYIEYNISETWDTEVKENKIYLMCGTSIEKDNVLINGQGVFGYIKGLQDLPILIKIAHPQGWISGTALSKNSQGYYMANNYDHIVDSPILLGSTLTEASIDVEGTKIQVYTYSKTNKVHSDQILSSLESMLKSASQFVNGLPVKRYTFLFHFEDKTAGAWEHSYSSEYIYKEDTWENLKKPIAETAAHEFFHVVTPLNIHSELIQEFNFIEPQASSHLWLYEGVTEWASHMMFLQAKETNLDGYFEMLQRKIRINNFYDPTYSLLKLSETSFSPAGQKQYGNIYMKGALVAGLLDIRLLELSKGEISLIDIINKLAKQYGPNKPFDEKGFFDEFVAITYPEIAEFFDLYIKNSNPLPIEDYYAKVGIKFSETRTYENLSGLNANLYPTPRGLYVLEDYTNDSMELKKGDMIVKIDGADVNALNQKEVMAVFAKKSVGSEYTVSITRGRGETKENITFNSKTTAKVSVNVFEQLDTKTIIQEALQQKWLN
ncbi:MAG: peptidase [Flavobacteriaceae bacterium]|nr:peptidase [Flavobacteriaceae bacterium]